MKKRALWPEINEHISDTFFRMIFCMNMDCFKFLSKKIIQESVKKKIKSESYINSFLKGKYAMYDTYAKSTGGYVAREVKLAITIKLFGGRMLWILVRSLILNPSIVRKLCVMYCYIGSSKQTLEI